MNQLAYAPQPKYEFIIQIDSGPNKGAQFRVVGGAVRLGRAEECDIVIDDQRVSRLHAIIELKSNGVFIKEVSAKSRMTVDGQQTKQASLKKTSKIVLGDTQIKFKIEKTSANPLAKNNANLQVANAQPFNYGGGAANLPPVKSNGAKKIVYLVLGAIVLFLMIPSNKKKGSSLTLRTTQEIKKEIEKNNLDVEKAKQNLQAKQTKEFKEANAAFKKGFRNYENGVYSRAIVNFQACLSLDKEHVLCNEYLPLAFKKQNELIQYQMIVGRQQKEQNQFKPCKRTFENIMFMVKDSSSNLYKEAYGNKEYCRLKLLGQY